MAQTKVKLISDGVIDVGHLASGHGITTDNIGEGSNLYYTDARVSTYLSANSYATEGYVTTAVANLVDSAPTTLDTLNELAAALGDDPNFATTVTNSIATKLPLAGGTLTGTLYAGGLVRLTGTTSSNSQLDLPVDWGALRWYDGTTFKGGIGTAGWSGVGSGNDLTVYLNNGNFHVSNNTSPFVTFDRANERVGIGTTSPTHNLHVYDATTNVQATFESGDATVWINLKDSASGTYGVLLGAEGSDFIIAPNNNRTAVFKTNGDVGIGTTSPSAKLDILGATQDQLRLRTASTEHYRIGRDSSDGLLYFYGSQSGYTGYVFSGVNGERMRITSAGNVGIGTSNPVRKLVVSNGGANGIEIDPNISGNSEIISYNRGTSSYTPLYFEASAYYLGSGNVGIGNTNPTSYSGYKVLHIGNNSTGGLGLIKFANGVTMDGPEIYAAGNSLRLNTNGSTNVLNIVGSDVGIGTTSPSAKLETNNGGYILKGGYALFSSYTSDGLFNSNAQPNFLSTNGYNGTYSKFSGNGGLLLGYQDNGAGLYSPAYGFEVKSIDGRPVGGQIVKAIVMHDVDTDEQPFWVNNNGSAYFKNDVGIGTTVNAGASARLSIYNGDTQEGLAVKMSGTTPYSPIAVRNQNNDYMFQLSQTGEVRINDAGIGLNETLRVKGVETAFRTYGSQSGYTQGAIVISSGTDSVPSARGQGIFYFNEGNDVTWYSGGLYQSADRFDICRKSSTTYNDTSTAQATYSLFHLNNGGSAYNATGTWGTISSDQRLKENIVDATPKLNDVMSLQVRNFNYIGQNEKYIGFIAQELEEVFPSLVTINDNREYDREGNVLSGFEDTKGVKVGMDFAILVKAIQEQQDIINNIKAEVEALKQQLNG